MMAKKGFLDVNLFYLYHALFDLYPFDCEIRDGLPQKVTTILLI